MDVQLPLRLTCSTHSFLPSRLNHDRHGGAWCPKPAIAEDVKEWLQVDLGAVHVVTGIVTQVSE